MIWETFSVVWETFSVIWETFRLIRETFSVVWETFSVIWETFGVIWETFGVLLQHIVVLKLIPGPFPTMTRQGREPYITNVLTSIGTLHAAFCFMVHEPASFMLPFVLWFMNQLPSCCLLFYGS